MYDLIDLGPDPRQVAHGPGSDRSGRIEGESGPHDRGRREHELLPAQALLVRGGRETHHTVRLSRHDVDGDQGKGRGHPPYHLDEEQGWSLDLARTNAWPSIRVPCLVLAFEHDVDSPPARSREAAARIPNARFVEIADASHLGVFTHGDQVASALVEFFGSI